VTAFPRLGFIWQGGSGWMGGSEYIRNLMLAVAAAGAPRPSLFCARHVAGQWRDAAADLVRVPMIPRLPFVDRLRLNDHIFAAALRRHPVDFLYPLSYGNNGLTFPLRRALGGTAWAGWIPDFQHRHLPQFFTPEQIAFRERSIGELLGEARTIVLSSASAADDLRVFHPSYGGRVEILRFTTPARAEWFEPFSGGEIAALPERFLLVCNQFWRHKNHLTVFRALALLAQRGVRPVLLCTGALEDVRDPAYPALIRQTLRDAGIVEQVRLLGLLPRRTQIELMRRCVALVQPSLFEGWSTVVEDARTLGKPVLLSDIPVHREQAPPGARYFAAESAEALAVLIDDAWQRWPHGIDAEAEAAARASADARLRQVGRHFLTIAQPQ